MLGNRESKIYIGTFQGSFTRKAIPGDENVTVRTNKLGREVKEVQFSTIDATLTKIEYKDSDYGEQLVVSLADGDEVYTLQTGIDSSLASTIINRLPNIQFTHQIELLTGFNQTKDRAWFALNQHGDRVEDYFNLWDDEAKTFSRLHDFPAWEKITVKGKETWDSSKQIEYQRLVVAKYAPAIEEAFHGATPITGTDNTDGKGVYEQAPVEEKKADDGGKVDKLPFAITAFLSVMGSLLWML